MLADLAQEPLDGLYFLGLSPLPLVHEFDQLVCAFRSGAMATQAATHVGFAVNLATCMAGAGRCAGLQAQSIHESCGRVLRAFMGRSRWF